MNSGKLFGGLMLIVLLACGGGGGSGNGNGTPIPDAQREAVINSVNAEFARLLAAGGAADAQNAALATFMASKPEFEAAGANADDGCAWGRFTDGRVLVVGNNRFPDRSAPGSFSWSKRPAAAFVAKSKQARLIHAFGPNFSQLQQPIADMSTYLKKDSQFTIATVGEGDGRLSTLKAVNGDAFFYLNAHGGKGTTKSGVEVFCVASSTPHNAGTDALPEMRQDFDDNLLVYYTGQTGDVPATVATTYAITAGWVSKYMSFSPNAIVFLNVCFTGNAHLEVLKLRVAMQSKGAAVVLGWTKLCNSATAFDASRYFVDRLMAANTFQKESPSQRAFSVQAVLADMGRKGKDKDGASSLVASYKAGVTDVELRPTIARMIMDERRNILALFGTFGDQVGEVTVNDVPATLVGNWSNDQLEVRIPDKGAGSDGPVVVKVNQKQSKARYLTSWRGNFHFNLPAAGGSSSLTESATLELHIRMDVDDYREEAGGVIRQPNMIGIGAARDSKLTWACSGDLRDANGAIAESWSGGGSPPVQYDSITAPVNAFVCNGVYDPATRLLSMGYVNGGPKSIFRKGQGTTQSLPLSFAGYQKNVDANWIGPVHDLGSGNVVIKWDQLLPTFPPPNDFYRRGIAIRSN